MWKPFRTDDGSWTLVHSGHGEACHSLAGAWSQARERYVGPSRLRELANEREVVRLLDIGTGLGLNLACALAALEDTGARLEAVSFELDPTVLEAAFTLREWPPEVAPWIARAHAGLAAELAHPGSSSWLRLELGDARQRLLALAHEPTFDAVFLDPFSPGIESELWEPAFVAEIAARMAPHALLSTYSASFKVRLALARAGLSVGKGPRVGRKAEGTLASKAGGLPPLDPRTQRRLAARCEPRPLRPEA